MDPKCTVCGMETVDGLHLGVQTCGACCAFFRRAVKARKTFRCLNNALCGKTQKILNRRMCKYCRLQKCLQAGMDPKDVNRRRNPKLSAIDPTEIYPFIGTSSPNNSPPSEAGVCLAENGVLQQIRNAQRMLDSERFYRYYNNKSANEKHPPTFMRHVDLFEQEVQLIGRAMASMSMLDSLSETDREKLFISTVILWAKFDAAVITYRNGGTYTNRTYQVDGAAIVIKDDFLVKYYSDLIPRLQNNPNPVAIFEVLVRCAKPVHAFQCHEVAERIRLARLDEVEMSAMVGLFICRDQHLGKMSERGQDYLLGIRRQVFMELFRHCQEIGKDPITRIAQLILLLEPIITVDIMMKQFFCVLTSQTQNVLEKNSQKLIEMVERLKI